MGKWAEVWKMCKDYWEGDGTRDTKRPPPGLSCSLEVKIKKKSQALKSKRWERLRNILKKKKTETRDLRKIATGNWKDNIYVSGRKTSGLQNSEEEERLWQKARGKRRLGGVHWRSDQEKSLYDWRMFRRGGRPVRIGGTDSLFSVFRGPDGN